MKTVQKIRVTLLAAALAAAGGAYALDSGGFMKVASTTNNTATQPPSNNAPGMPGHTEGDKERLPAASTGANTEASVDNAKQAVTDGALTTKIKTKLLAAKDLKSTGIHVKTKDRVVDLTGTVPTAEQRQMAVDAVKGVEGVESVHDHLKVSSH